MNDKYKESYVAKWTGLTLAKVIVIRHEEDIERMIKKGYSTDTIALILELPFGDVADAVVLLNHTPFV